MSVKKLTLAFGLQQLRALASLDVLWSKINTWYGHLAFWLAENSTDSLGEHACARLQFHPFQCLGSSKTNLLFSRAPICCVTLCEEFRAAYSFHHMPGCVLHITKPSVYLQFRTLGRCDFTRPAST